LEGCDLFGALVAEPRAHHHDADQLHDVDLPTQRLLVRKVDVRLPGKGNSNSHGTGPVHLITTMIKWIRTSRLSIKNSLSLLVQREKCVFTNRKQHGHLVQRCHDEGCEAVPRRARI